MTKKQIDHLMNNVGGEGCQKYLDAHGVWLRANLDALSDLFKKFVAETGSEMEFSPFCSDMFNETKPGQEAAAKYLRPMLS